MAKAIAFARHCHLRPHRTGPQRARPAPAPPSAGAGLTRSRGRQRLWWTGL